MFGRSLSLIACGFVALFITTKSAYALVREESKPTQLDTIKITGTGQTANDGTPEIIYEQGTLFVHSGFVPTLESRTSTGIWRIDPAFLTDISGKTLRTLSAWQSGDTPRGRLQYFRRSVPSYSVQGTDYVIVSISEDAPPLPSPALLPPSKSTLRNVTKATALSTTRFTATGQISNDGTPEVIYEQGDLFVKSGFVPKYESRTSTGIWRLDPAYLNDLSGKPLRNLSAWESDDSPRGRLAKFQRSAGYYWIQGAPAVIVAVAGSSTANDPPTTTTKPVVTLTAPSPNVTEGEPFAEFLLALDKPALTGFVVNYKMSGTAKEGKDYKKVKGSIAVRPGVTTVAIRVKIRDDNRREGTEILACTIKGGKGYRRDPDVGTTASMELIDND